MILVLPFWIFSICMALFLENPETHLHAAQKDQALSIDLEPMASEGLPDAPQNDAGGAGTPTG